MIESITTLLAILTVAGNIIIALVALLWIISRFKKLGFLEPITQFIHNQAITILFLIPASAIAGSLFYQYYANFEPCLLCWWQRIFMYPQAILALAALAYKTRDIIKYLIPLSVLGALTSALHYAEQMQARISPLADPFITCAPGAASCAGSYVFYYGYITIPMMTLTAFVLMLIVALIARKR